FSEAAALWLNKSWRSCLTGSLTLNSEQPCERVRPCRRQIRLNSANSRLHINLNTGSLFRSRLILISLMLVTVSALALTRTFWRVQGQTDSKVTTVSAASFA